MTHCFITGTDTEIGKTFVTAALLHRARRAGRIAVGYKPVAAGATLLAGTWANEDALMLHAASSPGFGLDEVNPVCLRQPVAPHVAAASEGVALEVSRLVDGYHTLARRADMVCVEGVGGFRVPLNDREDTADLAVALGLPVILVVGLRLGCINHALLTAEAIVRRGLTLAGWVANSPTPQPMPREDDTVAALDARLPAPRLGRVPYCEQGPAVAAERLHWPGGL